MIIVKGRELLIPDNERYIGTNYDTGMENRVFRIARLSQSGTDLSDLTFKVNLIFDSEPLDIAELQKTVDNDYIYLTWTITAVQVSVTGTVFVCVTGNDTNDTVKWSSFMAPFYTEKSLGEDVESEYKKVIAKVNKEITDRETADAALQSAISAETSARESEDASIQSAIATEESTRAAADTFLQSQINQIIAPSGEAPSAAEVQNARIDFYGAQHQTLGEAIRSIDGALNETLSDVVDSNIIVREHELTIATNLATWSRSNWIGPFLIPDGTTTITIDCDSYQFSNSAITNKIQVDYEDDAGTVVSNPWVTVFPATHTVPSGAKRIKFAISTNNGTALNTSVTYKDLRFTANSGTVIVTLKQELIDSVVPTGDRLELDNYTHTVASAGTWQFKEWAINNVQPCDRVRIRYSSITYNNQVLPQHQSLIAFDDSQGTIIQTGWYINVAENADYTFTVPNNTARLRFRFYVNAETSLNTSATINNLLITFIGTGEIGNRVTALDGDFMIPSYYRDNNYMNSKAEAIKELMYDAVGHYDSYIFITDMHWQINAKKSPALINWIKKAVKISHLVNGGDLYDAWDGLTEDALVQTNKAFGEDSFVVVGNHEFNHIGVGITNGGLTEAKAWYLFNSMHEDIVIGDASRNYFYRDNVAQKIRYIYLNVYEDAGAGASQAVASFETAQQNWLSDTALGTLESGWIAVIFTHALFEIDASTDALSTTEPFSDLITIVDAYNGPGEVAFIHQGHSHRDRITSTPGGTKVVITTCDKYSPWITPGGTPDLNVTRTPGTVTEQAFDVVVIDKKNRKVSLVRIGAPALDGIDDEPGEPVEVRQFMY